MKRIATVVAAGALALVAGCLVMLEASDQAVAASRGGGGHFGGGGHAVGGGRTMSRSGGTPRDAHGQRPAHHYRFATCEHWQHQNHSAVQLDYQSASQRRHY